MRGARNTPCAEFTGRRAASPAECGSSGSPVTAPNNPPFPPESPIGGLLGSGEREDRVEPSAAVVPYDPGTGRVVGPDGTSFYLTDVANAPTPTEDKTWQDLLLRTIDR